MNGDVLTVIPARGGSKRIPRKNLKPLGRKPLIAQIIDHAEASTNASRTVVSSEDDEIWSVDADHDGEVAFVHPPELAKEDAINIEVVEHALNWATSNSRNTTLFRG